jgi:hypothetical protein
LSAFSYSVKNTAGWAFAFCVHDSSVFVPRSTTASYSLFALRSKTFANDFLGNGWPGDQLCRKLFDGSLSFTIGRNVPGVTFFAPSIVVKVRRISSAVSGSRGSAAAVTAVVAAAA